MDISSFGIVSVAAITVIAYLVGMIVKSSGIDNKFIPSICGVTGLALGIAGMFLMPDYPAHDFISSAAVGIVSGFAATGIDQTIKQLSNKEM